MNIQIDQRSTWTSVDFVMRLFYEDKRIGLYLSEQRFLIAMCRKVVKGEQFSPQEQIEVRRIEREAVSSIKG